MTWAELIKKLPKANLQEDVTIYLKVTDEYIPAESLDFAKETDVLDKGHSFLTIDF